MISQIDIKNFGSFNNLIWKKCIKDAGNNVQNFKRLNILYGRNYSGKTTLSQIFRALEKKCIQPTYLNPDFTILGDNGNICVADIATHNYDVRVYNRDFVSDNLSFLYNPVNGEIKTFAIVGEKNKEIEDAIALIDGELGSVEQKSGFKFELEEKRSAQARAARVYKEAFEALQDKLRTYANDTIKKNRDYGTPVYNIDKIKQDILVIKKPSFKALSPEEHRARTLLLKQEALANIATVVRISLKIENIKKSADELLAKNIAPTQPIQELLNDNLLQLWVKQGITHHKEKRDTCAFCRQSLPDDLWQTLDSHFSRESFELESSIDSCLAVVRTAIDEIPTFVTLTKDSLYPEEQVEFDVIKEALDAELNVYQQDLKALQVALESRKEDLFKSVAIPDSSVSYQAIKKHVDDMNGIIIKSNGRTKTLQEDKASAQIALRLTAVATFANTINYDAEEIRLATLKEETEAANNAFIAANEEVARRERAVIQLRGQEKDERKGADRINSLLNHFFGHDGLKLEAKDDPGKTAVKFEITRDGQSAYNLSEGECSLIAFCYFMARLEEPGSKGKELIVYIDDPISSLDGNHIFFMFSLIESLLTRPVKKTDGSNDYLYKQLFISTHNLDFLKYLKRLSIPKRKVLTDAGKAKSQDDDEHFLIERNGASSNILLMPRYLKDYITEFNYLFHQIYKCRDQNMATKTYEPFYGFGNNLRKFLEAYLFFKYPHHHGQNDTVERAKKFFGEEEATATILINRLNNEFSHLESSPDRGFKPVEIPEISKVASFVLGKIESVDPDQYEALLKSIGESGQN